jgi:hypothetical protein
MTAMRHLLICQDEDGDWRAEGPRLPSCFSQGDTREEAETLGCAKNCVDSEIMLGTVKFTHGLHG